MPLKHWNKIDQFINYPDDTEQKKETITSLFRLKGKQRDFPMAAIKKNRHKTIVNTQLTRYSKIPGFEKSLVENKEILQEIPENTK